MRKWLKEIVKAAMREEVDNTPLIRAHRPPSEYDVYSQGTQWEHGEDIYVAKKVTTQWEKM